MQVLDTWMTPYKQLWSLVTFLFCCLVRGYFTCPLDGILSLRETQEQLCGLENVKRAFVDTGVRIK